jgi:hypothetical protein
LRNKRRQCPAKTIFTVTWLPWQQQCGKLWQFWRQRRQNTNCYPHEGCLRPDHEKDLSSPDVQHTLHLFTCLTTFSSKRRNQNGATKVEKKACVSLYITIWSEARGSSRPTAKTLVGRMAGRNTSRSRSIHLLLGEEMQKQGETQVSHWVTTWSWTHTRLDIKGNTADRGSRPKYRLCQCLAYSSILKMETADSSETLIIIYRTTSPYTPKDLILHLFTLWSSKLWHRAVWWMVYQRFEEPCVL